MRTLRLVLLLLLCGPGVALAQFTVPPPPPAAYATIQDEGTALTRRGVLNFIGVGVTCVDNSGSGRTDCTIAAGAGGVSSITGTANQVIRDVATGAVTLSLPQSIATTSSPTFSALTLTNPLLAVNGGTGFASFAVGDLLYASTTAVLSRLADVATGSVLTSGGVGVAPAWSALSGIAVTSITGTANQVIASASTGAVTLSTPQSIATSSTPQFSALGLGGAAGTASTLKVYGTTSGSIILAVPVAAGANTLTFPAVTGNVVTTGDTGTVTNAMLANSAVTVNGSSISLGGAKTLTLASSDFVNQGTTTTVLHGNAAGNPSFGAVVLTTDVSGILPVANGGTGLASGTSGGILAYTASGTLASSAALTANLPVIGGGAGVAPTVGTRSGNTTTFATTTGALTSGNCVKFDASGNLVDNGAICGGAGAPTGASYLTLGLDATLTAERVLTAGTGISFADTGVNGTLTVNVSTVPVANGGTNITSYAVGDLLYASGATTLSKLAGVAAGSYVRSGGVATAPVWSTTTLPNSATTGDVMYASATSTYANLAAVATGSVLASAGTSTAPVWTTSPQITALGVGTAALTAGIAFPHVGLFDDGFNKLVLRQGTTSQEFRVCRTWTSVSTYECLSLGWTGTLGLIQPLNAGGSARGLAIAWSDSFFAIQLGIDGATPLLLAQTVVASAVATGRVNIGTGAAVTATSGNHSSLYVIDTAAPTSTSTLVFTPVQIVGTVNYSAVTPGAGSYRGIYISMTETALPTGTSYLFKADAGAGGATEKFSVTNAGLMTTAGSAIVKGQYRSAGTAPTIGGSCGTGPAITGTDNAGKVTTGSGSPSSCTVTFAATWASAPACHGNNETTSNLLRATSTTTTLTLVGTMVASDVLTYLCMGGS